MFDPNLVERLRDLRVTLKSGEYDGADLMQAWCAMMDAADALLALKAEVEELRGAERRAVARCIAIAREVRDGFLSPEYATDQPLSSFHERFACDQVASAIEDRFAIGTTEQRAILSGESVK